MRTPPVGDAWFILAHQYIAAYLNGLNGADLSFVSDAYVHAAYLLGQYDQYGECNPVESTAYPC